jgi:hypothetical protein
MTPLTSYAKTKKRAPSDEGGFGVALLPTNLSAFQEGGEGIEHGSDGSDGSEELRGRQVLRSDSAWIADDFFGAPWKSF